MDHSNAQLLEYGQNAEDIRTIESEYLASGHQHPTQFSSGSGTGSHISNNESKENHAWQNKLNEYYKTLEKELVSYDEILLMGSSTAKEEFYNRVNGNQKFKTKKIYMRNSEKLTDRQFAAYINKILNEKLAKQ